MQKSSRFKPVIFSLILQTLAKMLIGIASSIFLCDIVKVTTYSENESYIWKE